MTGLPLIRTISFQVFEKKNRSTDHLNSINRRFFNSTLDAFIGWSVRAAGNEKRRIGG